MITTTTDIKKDAHRIVTTASYLEKGTAMIDAMLMTFSEFEWMGYNEFYKAVDSLTEEQQTEVAQYILDHRQDLLQEVTA